jgi:hypothetical protein
MKCRQIGCSDSQKSKNYILHKSGSTTADKLEGLMVGNQLTDLVTATTNGETYVNIHAEQNPNGKIRGQIQVQ